MPTGGFPMEVFRHYLLLHKQALIDRQKIILLALFYYFQFIQIHKRALRRDDHK